MFPTIGEIAELGLALGGAAGLAVIGFLVVLFAATLVIDLIKGIS